MRTSLFLALCAVLPACTDGDKDQGSVVSNGRPIAEAGDSITQPSDMPVVLSGSGSSDPDGHALEFHWSFDHVPDQSQVLSKNAPLTPNHTGNSGTTFAPDVVGVYVVRLTVTDELGLESDPDYVIVTIVEPSTLPVADAGEDIVTEVGASVLLDGSGSYDPLAVPITYFWSLLDKPAGSTLNDVSGADTVGAGFTPDKKGVYVVNLVVSNGLARSVSDSVTITAVGTDHAPISNAGPDQTEAQDCSTITLDCSNSVDPDGDPLEYMWTIQSAPAGSIVKNASFSDRTSATPVFYADVAGEYILSCAVSDGNTWATPDLVVINAIDRVANARPVVSAGMDRTIDGGNAECEVGGYSYECDDCSDVTIDLGRTATISDADGDAYTLLWTTEDTAIIADPTSRVTSARLKDPTASEPGVCDETEYEFDLTVVDCTGAASAVTDTVVYTVTCCGVEDTGR